MAQSIHRIWAVIFALAQIFFCVGCGDEQSAPQPQAPPVNSAPIIVPVPPATWQPPAGLTYEEPFPLAQKQTLAALWLALPAKARCQGLSIHLRPRPGERWPYGRSTGWYHERWVLLKRGEWDRVVAAHEIGHAVHECLAPAQRQDWATWSRAHKRDLPTSYTGSGSDSQTATPAEERWRECVAKMLVPNASGYRSAPVAIAKLKGYYQ